MNHPARVPPPSLLRYLSVLVIGLIAGGIGSMMLARSLQARVDPFPDALMQVMDRQLEQLKGGQQAGRCGMDDSLQRLQALRALGSELEPAFPGLAGDARFARSSARLRTVAGDALASPPTTCTALASAIDRLETACRSCHQDFR